MTTAAKVKPWKDLFARVKKQRNDGLPYLERYRFLELHMADPPKMSAFPGLLALQYFDSPSDGTEVIAWWRSKEVAESCHRRFEVAIGVRTPSFAGHLRELSEPANSWWKVPVGKWILYAASLFAALTLLQSHFARLFEIPAVAIELQNGPVLNFLASESVHFGLNVTNLSSEVFTRLELLPPKLSLEKEELRTDFSGNMTPAPIAPATTRSIEFNAGSLVAGTYTLKLAAIARSGLLRGARFYESTAQVRIWAPEPVSIFTSITPQGPRRADLRGQVLIGSSTENGLVCQVTIQDNAVLQFPELQFPGVPVWSSALRADDTQSFTFESSRPFSSLTSLTFIIAVSSSQVVEDWQKLFDNSNIICDRIEEGKT